MSTASSDERRNAASAAARQGVEKLSEEVEKIQSEIKTLSAKMSQIAGESLNRAQEGVMEGVHEAGEAVKRNPYSAVAIAVGLGLVLGALVRR